MRSVDCTFPDCPASAVRSPWEEDELYPHLLPGRLGQCTRLQVPRRSLDFAYSTMPVPRRDSFDVAHHAVVVLTARRPEATLGATLSSLVRGGADGWDGPRWVFVDGLADVDVAEVWSGWSIRGRMLSAGSSRAFVELLRGAVSVDPDLEVVTYVEDDVEVCANFFGYLRTVQVPADVSFVSWFTYDYDWSSQRRYAGPHPSEARLPVLACRTSRFFVLAQALTVPRRTIDRLLNCPMVGGDRWPSRDGQDLMMGWALGDSLYAVHFPVLVQHVGGANSAVKLAGGRACEGVYPDPQDGDRRSPYYVGEDFDALSLLEKGR